MRLLQVMCLGLIMTLTACAAKHAPLPIPVYGVDIQKVNRSAAGYVVVNNDSKNYDGMFFSNEYLNEYLQWKCADEGKC